MLLCPQSKSLSHTFSNVFMCSTAQGTAGAAVLKRRRSSQGGGEQVGVVTPRLGPAWRVLSDCISAFKTNRNA